MNLYTNVTALAIYSGVTAKRTLTETDQLAPLVYKTFMHKGSVLNIEDFHGTVEFTESAVLKNVHFISEASA
jgi:hypothetical protein